MKHQKTQPQWTKFKKPVCKSLSDIENEPEKYIPSAEEKEPFSMFFARPSRGRNDVLPKTDKAEFALFEKIMLTAPNV